MKKTKVFFFVCWLTLISGFAFAAAPDYVNDIPKINGSPAVQIHEDKSYNFTPTASDDDTGDTLTFSITNKPSWASFDPNTGTLTGTPGNKDVGTANSILIEVTDSAGAKDSLPGFSITVLDVNDKPSISIIPDQTIDEDTTTEVLHFTISDVDTPVEQLSIIAKSSDTDLIPNENIVLGSGENRTIVISPAPDKHGTCIITITVSDNELTTLQSFVLTVNSIIDPAPVVDFTVTPDLIALGGTGTISWNVEHADVSIDIDRNIGAATKSDSRTVSPSSTTTYTLTAVGEGGTTSAQVTVEVDNVPPTMISFFPKNNTTIPSQGGTVTLAESFGDNLAGIKSVTLLDGNNTDITSNAVITPNTSQYVINTPEDKSYKFKVVLEDNVGNSHTHSVTFAVDNTKPVTTPSLAAGRYSSAQTVSLTCSEKATIYYSTDGYPPFAGASNTHSGSSPVENIVIKNTTRLQFFAIDNAGNREAAKSVDYFFNDANEALTGLTASYDENLKHVQLSWDQRTDVQRYNIYRCMNMADRTILSDSQTYGYPPAKRLKIANTADNTSNFTDSNLVESAAYYYGVSYIDEDGNESIISDIAEVVIIAQGQAVSKEEAVARAVAWLQNNQKANGSWGETGKQILATSQALNGLKLANVQNAGIYYGLFFLRGNHADNVDYLARKIITLFNHGQNVDEFVNNLILKSYISKAQIYGWGVKKIYMVDALNTALATKALACIQIGLKDSQGNSLTDQCKLALDNWGPLQSSENKKYGWEPKEDISPFVSASVYSVTTPSTDITNWLTQLQQTNGSFKDNAIDTAGILIWQNNIVNNKEKAYEFLISKQNINGSWGDDPYLTGLCLEALLK